MIIHPPENGNPILLVIILLESFDGSLNLTKVGQQGLWRGAIDPEDVKALVDTLICVFKRNLRFPGQRLVKSSAYDGKGLPYPSHAPKNKGMLSFASLEMSMDRGEYGFPARETWIALEREVTQRHRL